MRGRIRGIRGHEVSKLSSDWEMCAVPSKSATTPDSLTAANPAWMPAASGQTVAAALRALGKWSIDGPPRNFDAEDFWYRTRFARPPQGPAGEVMLRFDGLATVADVWLNGKPLFESRNMFTTHERDVGALLEETNELLIRFRSLETELAVRRPRPRYKTPMVANQQLRHIRTTLLGRTPGWSPPAAAVGPWREVWLERRTNMTVSDVSLSPLVDGSEAWLTVTCTVRRHDGAAPGPISVVLTRNGDAFRASLEPIGDAQFRGTVHVTNVARWWPHTHGEPALYATEVSIGEGAAAVRVDLGPIGFRELELRKGCALYVNRVRVFCRGACWTPLDPVTLDVDETGYDRALRQARDAGMNMIRVGGTMTYESDAFYDAADRHGILLWHDFMFANMDYPFDEDAAFQAEVRKEASQFLGRMQGRPSLAVLCGNSEMEQQAAMWGAPREAWSPPLFHDALPTLCRELLADVPYWPSSTHGGAFPHDPSEGTCSYYGVGAYLRDVGDLRRSNVRFATETLAFANVPAPEATPGGPAARVHHAAWKSRTPRDLGAGWDFDDVRDYYAAKLFDVDVMKLRYEDHDRYLALGRVVTGELMATSMGEWRSQHSVCGGALVWFYRDLWSSAGWGVTDSRGEPKAAYYYLKRAQQPLALFVSDEGLSGPVVQLANDSPHDRAGTLTVSWYRDDGSLQSSAKHALTVRAHRTERIPVASITDHWTDLTHAYRFGPRVVDVLVAVFESEGEQRDAFFFPGGGLARPLMTDIGLTAESAPRADGSFDVAFTTKLFAQSVALELEGLVPSDNYFHVAPGQTRRVHMTRAGGSVRANAQPLNARNATKIPAP